MNFGLSPLAQESAPLRRKLAATLRRLVETGVLKAGQRVIEKDLCAELEVSRTVLREALRLQADEIALWNDAGFETIDARLFRPLTRASVRLAAREKN